MGVTRTRTIKNKHATNKSGIKNSKANKKVASTADGVLKSSASARKKGATPKTRPLTPAEVLKKKLKKKKYTAEELGIPELNRITPVGVTKPKGKKKGKVFVDDKESMNTIMAIVQAEKEGQLESKIMKARQMEEIREARKKETESREAAKNDMLEDVKNSLRKKRKRSTRGDDEDKVSVKHIATIGSKATKKRKNVSFAA